MKFPEMLVLLPATSMPSLVLLEMTLLLMTFRLDQALISTPTLLAWGTAPTAPTPM
jgi:hypothetical protein